MIAPNNTKIQPNKVPSFFLSNNSQQTKNNQTKSSKNLNVSLGAYESPYQYNTKFAENKSSTNINQRKQQKSYKFMQRSDHFGIANEQNRKIALISSENSRLKEENEFLRKQLQKIKVNQSERIKVQSSLQKNHSFFPSRSQSPHQLGDLRNTIKKEGPFTQHQISDSKELKIKLQIVSKQCRTYEQIIKKMQLKIRQLTDENKSLNSSVNLNHNSYNNEKDTNRNSNNNINININSNSNNNKKQQFQFLKEKVNLVMKQYSQLQSKMHSNELQWVIWKEQWITEKNIYLNRIKQLQAKLKDKDN